MRSDLAEFRHTRSLGMQQNAEHCKQGVTGLCSQGDSYTITSESSSSNSVTGLSSGLALECHVEVLWPPWLMG